MRLFPSLTDFAFLLPVFLLFVMLPGPSILLGDGDTGWHIRTGDWILQHRMVPTVDFFSFTKAGQPWFAWEWGWDVLFSAVHHFAGLAGVVFVNVLLLGFISALLFRLIRRCSGNDLLAFLLTILSTCGCMIHWLARPHLFSWLFVLIFAHIILSAENGNKRLLWYLPLVTLLWANIHGAFFVGILMLLASAIGEAARALGNTENWLSAAWSGSKAYLTCVLACASASLVNPYTWRLHVHIYRYLLDSKLLDNIQEYQSINFHHGPVIFFECMLLLGVGSALWCLRSGKISAAILIVLWAHLALVSARNAPIFLLIAAPWTACMLQDTAFRVRSVRAFKSIAATLSEICNELRPLERIKRLHFVSAVIVLFLAGLFASSKPGFAAEFDTRKFPAEAIPVIEAAKASRIFTYDQWGDYLIYRLYPSERVFMDGRSDFYGVEFVNRYQHMIAAGFDSEADLKRFAIDMVILKPDAPLATLLKQSRDWKLLLDDGRVLVFQPRATPRDGVQSSSVLRNGRNGLEAFGLAS